ncbi:MAG: hypothetical protein K9K67_03725 [Bacteriovoracaceae bacterium]|nr:hypothetical protein [Bacteriovoracaceae bacterium]
MKQIILVLFGLFLMGTMAAEVELITQTDDYIVYNDDWGTQSAYILGLEPDLFQKFVIKESRGPKWLEKAEAYLESEHDFHEWASYYGERVEDRCDEYFNEPEDVYDAYNTWELRWKAVKNKSGSKKSQFYIVEFVTLIEGPLGTCELLDGEYVFLNKLKDGAPVYLGEFSQSLPKF